LYGAFEGLCEFIFLVIKNYVYFKLNCRELRVELHKPPLKMKELKDLDVVWLNQLSETMNLILLQFRPFGVVQCVGKISNVY
jgi:hypothetical protein